ncbi:MAG: PAS-domain containing protein [Hyphomonadaceae bacterium]
MDGGFAAFVVAAGAAALGIAALLWALRVTDGANGSMKRMGERMRAMEDKIARADAIFGAHPGVVLIWDDPPGAADSGDWGAPRTYGSALALASLLRFSDSTATGDPAVRILRGLATFDATDATGAATRLAPALARLRREGAPFSLTISTPEGVYVELDGRTAGASAVVWIVDASVRGVEDGVGRGVVKESHEVIALDITAPLKVLAQAPFMAWRVSAALKLEWANNEYLRALESKSLDQAIARNLTLDAAATEQARKVIETGETVEETRFCVVGGARRALRIVMMPVSGGAGGVAIDVTEAEEARDQLESQSRAHDETLNHLAEGVAVFGPDKRLVFHNRAFAEMWDLEPAFLADRPSHAAWLDHLKERGKLPAHASYAEWRAGELALYQEVADLPEALWILPESRTLRIARQRHPGGGLLLVFSDMTNEITLRSQYAALLQTQKAALDKLHEAVAVFGLDGRMKLSNAAFATMWQLTGEQIEPELPFERMVEMCKPLFHDAATWALVRARITDPSPEARVEYRGEMRRSDGAVLTFLTRPLPDGATLIAFLDISATRRVEDALRDRAEAFEAADRLKTEFVQNVSLQLRNPLQAISGNAEMLSHLLFGPLNDRQVEQVSAILEASEDLSKLVDNILDVALVEAGGVQLDLAPLDIYSTLKESAQFAASKARDTEVPIKIACDPAIGAIEADPKRITQVLVNLLSNALRHTERGDQITIGAERLDGVVRLWVSDTGHGMPFEAQARAFDAFQSGDRRGAGLGLALVRSFVQMHGGWVAIQSEPGQGATVSCHLPAHETLAPPPAPVKNKQRAA